jgi:serine/threonine-protein kinase ATR
MLSPFFPQLSPVIVSGKKDLLNEATLFMGIPRTSFVEATLQYSIPHAVLRKNKPVLDNIASLLNRSLGLLLVDHSTLLPHILKAIYMQKEPKHVPEVSTWLMQTLQLLTQGGAPIAIGNLLSTHVTNLLVEVIVELGDKIRQPAAEVALQRIYRASTASAKVQPSQSAWLKGHMLGIITGISDIMHDARGRKNAEDKAKIVRSIGSLIEHVGIAMSGFSSQVSSKRCVDWWSGSNDLLYILRLWPSSRVCFRLLSCGKTSLTFGIPL